MGGGVADRYWCVRCTIRVEEALGLRARGIAMKDLRSRIEADEAAVDSEPTVVQTALREERVTVRWSVAEMRQIDLEAQRVGVGRSTVIRMLVRTGLHPAQGPTPPGRGRR